MKRGVLVALALLLVGGSAAAVLLLRGTDAKPTPVSEADRGGRGVAAGLLAAAESSAKIVEPRRCALGSLDQAAKPAPVGTSAEWVRSGAVVTRTETGRGQRIRIGLVADARGPTATTLARLEQLVAAFEKRKVSLVVSLGGLGKDAPEIRKALAALSVGRAWLVVAIPGDRESVAGHRAAVAAVQKAGGLIVDGSRVRLLNLGGATIGTFPGVERAEQLVAGDAGCMHTAADAATLARALAARAGPRIWLGYAPPRQRGRDASDRAIGGVHLGEQLVTRAITGKKIAVVVHALVDEAAVGMSRGSWTTGQTTAFLAAGAIEAAPVTGPRGATIGGAALVLEVDDTRVRWQPIRF